jgi:glucose/arabinose dehydrogenase
MLEIHFDKLKIHSLAFALFSTSTCHASTLESSPALKLKLPAGFNISVFSKLNSAPRMMAFNKDGNLFVSLVKSNQIVMLQDSNKDGLVETVKIVAENLNSPNGLAFVGDDLLVANQDGVVKISKLNQIDAQDKDMWSKPTPFINNLATGWHTLKTIKVSADNFLYINVGSSCNVCAEEDASRATLLRYTLEGKPAGALQVVGRHTNILPIWASGLRNTQGFAWQPNTNVMYATNEGADNRSEKKNGKVNDELPPEHLNKIEAGNNYGWPYCWGDRFEDPNFTGPVNFCKNSTPPAITFTSHSTPIGITFLNHSNFPLEYKNDAIVALHGSWNRNQPSGYKLVRIKFSDNKPTEVVDFATGWLNNSVVRGRPVDVIVGTDGALYVSDDQANLIYRIVYGKNDK